MQIKIKTAQEFRDAHVTIQVPDGQRFTVELDGDGPAHRLYTAQEVGDYQASEAELVATPLRKRIEELECEARMSAATDQSLRRQLADETKRADKWGMTAARNHSPDGVYARAQELAAKVDRMTKQLAERETAVTELRTVVDHRNRELNLAADNFKISQDKNRDLRLELDQVRADLGEAERQRAANREWAERAERAGNRVTILDGQRDAALVKLSKIGEVIDADTGSIQQVAQVRNILDQA